MDEVINPGGGVVTRFEGSAEETVAFLGELSAQAGGDPQLDAFIAAIFSIDEFDATNADVEFEYELFLVRPSDPNGDAVSGNPVIIMHVGDIHGDRHSPPTADDAEGVVGAVSGMIDSLRVVGPVETNAAIAIPAYQDYTIRSKVSEGLTDAEADFFLIV